MKESDQIVTITAKDFGIVSVTLDQIRLELNKRENILSNEDKKFLCKE